MKSGMAAPQANKHSITIWSSKTISGYIPQIIETRGKQIIYTLIFIAALLNSSQKVEATHVSINRWMNKQKVEYIYTTEYYLVLKRKQILSNVTTWMNLEDIMRSEINQSQRDKYCIIPLKWNTRVVRFIETESRMVVVGGWGEGVNGKLLFNRCRVSIVKDENF